MTFDDLVKSRGYPVTLVYCDSCKSYIQDTRNIKLKEIKTCPKCNGELKYENETNKNWYNRSCDSWK